MVVTLGTSRPTRPTGAPGSARRQVRRRRARLAAALTLVVLVLVTVWFARELYQARSHLSAASGHVDAMLKALGAGDTERANAQLAAAQDESAAARDITDGRLWPAYAALPLLGDDVRSIRTVAIVADDVTQRALPPVVEAGRVLVPGDFAFVDGRMDLSPLVSLRPSVARMHDVLQRNDERLDAMDVDGLIGALREPVDTLRATVSDAATASDTAERAMRVLPAMLGTGGPRTYLVVVQSNARIRATGGYPGTYLLVRAEGGQVEVAGQGASSADLVGIASVPQTTEEMRLFGGRLGQRFVDANLTPDYPRVAELQASAYERDHPTPIDGVVSVDPVALSYLLEGMGPVELDDGSSINSLNVVDLLLNRVYQRYPRPAQQERYLQQVARRMFVAFTNGVGEPRQVLEALSRGTSEGRVLVWSSHLEDEIVFAGTAVSGSMPPSRSTRPQVGVYLNDTTGARLQYYLDRSLGVDVGRCGPGGPQMVTTLDLESRVPAGARNRPGPVNGSGRIVTPGTMRMDVLLFAPVRGAVDDVRVGDRRVTPRMVSYDGRPVAVVPVTIAPGERLTVTAEMRGTRRQTGAPRINTTPGASTVPVRVTEQTCS